MDQFSKNVMDILQLYEFSMAIGKSFDYKENCDSLLRLIMARKDLRACWIYSYADNRCRVTYSIPEFKQFKLLECNKPYLQEMHERGEHFSMPITEEIRKTAPFKLNEGAVAVYNLKEEGLLFLYSSKRENFSTIELNQLSPIIEKFSLSLQASGVFLKREQLLVNLERQNKELSDYAHIVSHDLKSPIRNIEALTSWIKEDYAELLDDNGLGTFKLISDNLEKMDGLIDGILKYSTIDKNEAELYDIDLNDLVVKTIAVMPVPEHFTIDLKNDLPTIQGEFFRMQQLFQNLIGNAIKYNDKPKGLIEIGSKEVDEGYEFYVKDNGIGIEAAYHEKIFQIFQSLESDQNSTGIGLSVVKKIVDHYGGKIWLESVPNEGTVFYFTLYPSPQD